MGFGSTRISGVGSRFDKVGGEAALLCSVLNRGGGEVGREHISGGCDLSALDGLTDERLGELKSALIAKIGGASYESQMFDHVHSTAFQSSPSGNSLGNALEGTAESVASVTVDDVKEAASRIAGSNVVVVGTGIGNHDTLVSMASEKYGSLPGTTGKEVATAGEKAAFIGSDVRCVRHFCCLVSFSSTSRPERVGEMCARKIESCSGSVDGPSSKAMQSLAPLGSVGSVKTSLRMRDFF